MAVLVSTPGLVEVEDKKARTVLDFPNTESMIFYDFNLDTFSERVNLYNSPITDPRRMIFIGSSISCWTPSV